MPPGGPRQSSAASRGRSMASCARPTAPRRSSRQATCSSHSSASRACTRSSPCSLSSSFIGRSRTAPSPRGRPAEAHMGDLWFCLLAFMGIMYVILDGFDLGAGAIHLVVARSDAERRLVLRSIGPVWDGNEVWLIAAGGILYWYTVTVGLTALAALVMHGALWVQLKTEGALQARAKRIAAGAWWGAVGLTLLITVLTWIVQPQVQVNVAAHPWGVVFPAVAAAGLFGVRRGLARGAEASSFLASAAYLAGMLASAAFSVHPFVLPAIGDARHALTVDNAAAPGAGLRIGLAWWVPGMLLAVAYCAYTYRRFRGRVTLEGEGY